MPVQAMNKLARPFRFTASATVVAVSVTLAPLGAHAQTTPDSGSILQQVPPLLPNTPAAKGTGLELPARPEQTLPMSEAFLVKELRITGNTQFDTARLSALMAEGLGQSLTLPQIAKLAAKVTDYYRTQGYPLARAIIPAQSIRDGVVQVLVIEARYGKVAVDNQSQVSTRLLDSSLAPLQAGDAISQDELDYRLLLLKDIPGLIATPVLRAGEAVGSSDLVVKAQSGDSVQGNAVLDNYGGRYTGQTRASGSLNVLNPLRQGDILGLSGMSSGTGMNYARASYEALLTGSGLRTGLALSDLGYKLGDSLESSKAHGTAQTQSLWAKHPLARSQNTSINVQLQFDRNLLRDHTDATSIHNERTVQTAALSLDGNHKDTSGAFAWSLGTSSGSLSFDNTAAKASDASTTRTDGSFNKWDYSANRLQNIGSSNALYFAVVGQGADKNLDSSQKMSVGGPSSVRAYDAGTLSGDSVLRWTAEWRSTIAATEYGTWQGVVFADGAQLTINQKPWTSSDNTARLSGAGVGINWFGPDNWLGRAYVAKPHGDTPSQLSAPGSTRTWVELSKRF